MATAINTTAFPLPGDVLCPGRSVRQALRIQNPDTNDAVAVTLQSGAVFTVEPGGTLWETGRQCPQGGIKATGTAGQTLTCEETFPS